MLCPHTDQASHCLHNDVGCNLVPQWPSLKVKPYINPTRRAVMVAWLRTTHVKAPSRSVFICVFLVPSNLLP